MRKAIVAAAVLAFGASLVAQDASPRFEVVSIKPVTLAPGPGIIGMQFQPGGRFVGTRVNLTILLNAAFREPDQPAVRPNEILNLPPWATTEYYSIEAREPPELGDQQLNATSPTAVALVRSLLEDRFKLQAHLETREMQVYALKLARSDGRLGPNMKPAAVDCQALARERAAAAAAGHPMPPPFASGPPAPGVIPPCGGIMRPGEFAAGGTTAGGLTSLIAGAVQGATVVDHTGLAGSYDVTLRWAPDTPVRAAPGASNAVMPDAPSIFTAVEEQLGLKLESAREQRRVIVVDHVEQPKAD